MRLYRIVSEREDGALQAEVEGDLCYLIPMEAHEETRVGVTTAEMNLFSLALEDRSNGGTMSVKNIRMAKRYKTDWEEAVGS